MKTNRILGFCSLFFVASLFFALLSEGFERLPIVGGESIGLAKLGMTAEEIKRANEDSLCPVEAIFFGGKAVELRTSWGGGCATPEGMMASTYSAHFLKTLYGSPEFIRAETEEYYEGLVVDWWHYYKLGLAFRVVYTGYRDSIVQMIAVFPKSINL